MSAPPDHFAGKTRTRTVRFGRGVVGRNALFGGCILLALGAGVSAFAHSEAVLGPTPPEQLPDENSRPTAIADDQAAHAVAALPHINFTYRATELAVTGDSEAEEGGAAEKELAGSAVAASPESAASQARAENNAEAEAGSVEAPVESTVDAETDAAVEDRPADTAPPPQQVATDELPSPTDAADEPVELAQLEEPSAQEEPLAEAEPLAQEEPSANEEPSADNEPSAGEEPPAGEEPSAEEESATPVSSRVAEDAPAESEKVPPKVANSELIVPTLPRARNIDLTEPVVGELQSEVEVLSSETLAETDISAGEELVLLGARVQPGTTTRLSWSPHDAFEGISVPTPVLVVNGAKPGPVLCLTGAVHGDELNGIEVIRRVLYDLNAADVSGAVIGVPIVNQPGFQRNSRYLPDRRDLNRYFPGTPDGSSAARIAYSFFQDIVVNCDMLVDIHTGSFHRTNLPQLRADLNNPAVAEFARAFGDMVVLHGEGQPGTLRREAVDIGIPAVTVEAGEPMRIQEGAVADGVKGIRTLMTSLGMSSRPFFWSRPRPAYYHSYWVRASRAGLLMSSVELGAQVREGDVLGVVINPITNEQSEVVAPFTGKVIGMALNQVVMPGFAAYHVGIQASEEEMRQATDPGIAQAPELGVEEPEDATMDAPRASDGYESDVPAEAQPDAPDHREE